MVVLHGKIGRTERSRASVSFELEGHDVEFVSRGAHSPVGDGDVISLVVRRGFLPIWGSVALAFAFEGETKVRSVGIGLPVSAVLFGLPLLLVVTAIEVFGGGSAYDIGRESEMWPAMTFGWSFVGYGAYRLVEIVRAVKLLREHLQTSPAHDTSKK